MTDFNIDERQVLIYLRSKDCKDETVLSKIREEEKRLKRVYSPKYVSSEFDISFEERGVHLLGTNVYLTGNSIKKHLKGCEKCVVFGATLSMGCEMELVRLTNTDISSAVIFDAVCSDMIEKVCDRCQDEIKQNAAARGLEITDRFSPGYGDLPIELQGSLIFLINAQKLIGLTLTDTQMMIPTKSVTAIVGERKRISEI